MKINICHLVPHIIPCGLIKYSAYCLNLFLLKILQCTCVFSTVWGMWVCAVLVYLLWCTSELLAVSNFVPVRYWNRPFIRLWGVMCDNFCVFLRERERERDLIPLTITKIVFYCYLVAIYLLFTLYLSLFLFIHVPRSFWGIWGIFLRHGLKELVK